MPIKGKVPEPGFIDKQEEFLKLLEEALNQGQITEAQLAAAFKLTGFSDATAAAKAKDWVAKKTGLTPESPAVASKRLKDLASKEKFFVRNSLTKKKYDELVKNHELKLIFS